VDENWGLGGDKLGMQPPVGGCTTAQKESRATKMARENTSFSEIVSVLENTLVGEEACTAKFVLGERRSGLEPPTRGL